MGEFDDTGGSFVNIVLDNLRKAGVQNTVKQERLVFDRLEPYSGLYLQAAGDYTPEGGNSQRFAICIGPQYETVGPDLVNQAAKEAVQGLGFNLLIVLGFAFDPHTSFRLDSCILEPLSIIQQFALRRSVANMPVQGASLLRLVFGKANGVSGLVVVENGSLQSLL